MTCSLQNRRPKCYTVIGELRRGVFMDKKPDLLLVLAVVFVLGAVLSNYLPVARSPELVAQELFKK
jgi:hypothetical protein